MKQLYSTLQEEAATPGNTMGMGNPMLPSENGEPGTEPITPVEKPRKKKKHCKQCDRADESLLSNVKKKVSDNTLVINDIKEWCMTHINKFDSIGKITPDLKVAFPSARPVEIVVSEDIPDYIIWDESSTAKKNISIQGINYADIKISHKNIPLCCKEMSLTGSWTEDFTDINGPVEYTTLKLSTTQAYSLKGLTGRIGNLFVDYYGWMASQVSGLAAMDSSKQLTVGSICINDNVSIGFSNKDCADFFNRNKFHALPDLTHMPNLKYKCMLHVSRNLIITPEDENNYFPPQSDPVYKKIIRTK